MAKDIRHERTRTSREVRSIEQELTRELTRLVNRIKRDPNYPLNIPALRQTYASEVRAIMQKGVQQAYLKGVDYVSEFEDVPAVLSGRDLQNIEREAQSETEGFFRNLQRHATHEQVPEMQRDVNLAAMASLLAIAATNNALALATTDKTQQLGDRESRVMWVTAVDERVCIICRPLHRRTWDINDPNLLKPIEDSHPNCRCRLLLSDGREVFSH